MNYFAKLVSVFLLGIVIFTMSNFSFPADAAASHPEGSLLQRNKTVYYIGSENKKYVFPDEKTYFTWFDSWQNIKEVSSAELDKYQDGGVVTYRPGTKLITHQNTAKIYAVEPGGILRWIPDETTARKLYGYDWAKLVQDVIPGYFATSYIPGDNLRDYLPTGTVINSFGHSEHYYIDGNCKRKFSNIDAFLDNRLYFDNTVVGNFIDNYIDGLDVSQKEAKIFKIDYKFDKNDIANCSGNVVDEENNEEGQDSDSNTSGDQDSDPEPGPQCGNFILENEEECDDGPEGSDSCDISCMIIDVAPDPEPEITPYDISFPFQIFIDQGHTLDTGGYSQSELEEIAEIGWALWPLTRIYTESGQEQINIIKDFNPNFRVIAYYNVFHSSANDPGPWRPIDQEKYNLFKDHWAKHEDGAYVIAWPDPATSDAHVQYWLNPLPATSGYAYNRELLEAEVDMLSRHRDYYPDFTLDGMFFDYYQYIPWVWPSAFAEHGYMDLDQDGIIYQNDNDEIEAWLNYQRDQAAEFQQLYGRQFKNIFNGRASLVDYNNVDKELASLAQGAILEGFPSLPWNYSDEQILDLLASSTEPGHYTADYFGNYWNIMNLKSLEHLQLARISSLVFLQPYFVKNFLGDIGQQGAYGKDDYNIDTGEVLANLQVLNNDMGGKRYQRDFVNGCARIDTDNNENAVFYDFLNQSCNYIFTPTSTPDTDDCLRGLCYEEMQ